MCHSPCDFFYKDLNIFEVKLTNDGPEVSLHVNFCEVIRHTSQMLFLAVTMQCYFHLSLKDGGNLFEAKYTHNIM